MGTRGRLATIGRLIMDARGGVLFKTLVPTLALVLVLSLIASQALGTIFARTHERHADLEAGRFAAGVQAVLEREMAARHPNLRATLASLCTATGKSVSLADRAGLVRFACDESLLGGRLDPTNGPTAKTTHAGARWRRRVHPMEGGAACTSCHGTQMPIGHLAIDSPLEQADEEVRQQKTMNLITGGVMACALSGLLALTQFVLVHRPLRSLTATVEKIRGGDLAARTEASRADELGMLAQSVNAMAASIEQAKVELDRTHRAELAQAEKLAALGQLTSSIAHEIKNPLSGIIGALKVIESDAAPEDPAKPVLGKVLGQVERLSKTAVSLLEFARPLRPAVEVVDVVDLVERTLFFVERRAAEQRVELRRRYPPKPPAARADPDLMKQVLLNLLLNGIQAMPGGGSLEVEVRPPVERAVEIVVSDQGLGIPAENLRRIFSPFFSTKPGGTGLGLYVARQIVETQRGEIRVESRLGQGTSFTVRLPAAEPADGGRHAPA